MPPHSLEATEYTIGWICALPIELAAAQAMLDEQHTEPPYNGRHLNSYTFGRIGQHNVVLAILPSGQTGTSPAAVTATHMMNSFPSVRIGLMVGVGGGVPSAETDVRLGDVVVSHPFKQHGGVVQYDSGKTGRDGVVTRTGSLNTPPDVLLYGVSQLRANHLRQITDFAKHTTTALDQLPSFSREKAGPDVLYDAAYHHDGGASCDGCSSERIVHRKPRGAEENVRIHYGTIASGNQVMKDGATRDRLSAELGGVLCFEMEAAGLMNNFPCLVVRGICDYADSHKNERWQPFAALAAAAYAKELLSTISATEVPGHGTLHDDVDREVEFTYIEQYDLHATLANQASVKRDKHGRHVKLNWQKSLVDLLKLLELDSSAKAQERLAQRLQIRTGLSGSTEQNTALYKAVKKELIIGEDKWAKIMEGRRRNKRCLNCGLKGHEEYQCEEECNKCLYFSHKASNCKFLVRCLNCDKPGHMSEDCPWSH